MNDSFLPFAVPEFGEEEIAEVVDSLRSGWVTTGPKTRQFEHDFNQFLGGDLEAIAVNSATAGLHLALEAVGIKPGDEVITTTHTFTATAEVIRYLGADPVFVDINPDTYNIAYQQIEQKITPRTRAIIPVHFAGLACDMDEILDIASRHQLKVVEDAAHALPTTYRKSLVGKLKSDVTVFSFYATKTITTGEGGMIVTDSPDIAQRCRVMRLHGISRDAFDRYSSTRPSWHYDVIAPGYKYNMTDIAASLGIHQLKKLYDFQRKREGLANFYFEALEGLPVVLPPASPDRDMHAWHLFVIRLRAGAPIGRDELIQQMSDRGIGCSVHFIPLHLQSYWKESYGLSARDYPSSQILYEGSVSLPLYTKMTEKDASRVAAALSEILTPR